MELKWVTLYTGGGVETELLADGYLQPTAYFLSIRF